MAFITGKLLDVRAIVRRYPEIKAARHRGCLITTILLSVPLVVASRIGVICYKAVYFVGITLFVAHLSCSSRQPWRETGITTSPRAYGSKIVAVSL